MKKIRSVEVDNNIYTIFYDETSLDKLFIILNEATNEECIDENIMYTVLGKAILDIYMSYDELNKRLNKYKRYYSRMTDFLIKLDNIYEEILDIEDELGE